MTRLIIDAGHGGADPGAVGNGIVEKDMNLQISIYQYTRFKQLGVNVSLTRSNDKTMDSVGRTNIVKASGAKHCISNHINAGGGDGHEVIHSVNSNGKFANLVAKELSNVGQNLRRVFSRKNTSGTDYYFMHRMTGNVETIIVEYGFLDSKKDDVAQLKANWQKYAEAVVKAYCAYIGHKYVAPGAKKETVQVEKTRFSDVKKANGYYEDIELLVKEGIVGGYEDGTFKPNEPVTRGQMSKIIANVIRKKG